MQGGPLKIWPWFLACALLTCGCCLFRHGQPAGPSPTQARVWDHDLPVYDHVVIVVEENKDFDEVIGKRSDAPFINDVLRAQGASLTRMYGEEHHSQGNYFWLFSGSDQGGGFRDQIPKNPLKTSNLGEALVAAGRSFKGYSESLPRNGDRTSGLGLYARKHVPWASYDSLLPYHLRFEEFPKAGHFAELPTVSFVIPNLDNDMHNGRVPRSIRTGDAWLQRNLGEYYRWASDNNSVLIVTWDENDHAPWCGCITDPADSRPERRNNIPTILAGARIKQGDYEEGSGVTHVNLLRTLEHMFALRMSGAQQPFAEKAGISDRPIVDVFERARRDP
jgi:acid phosphatase